MTGTLVFVHGTGNWDGRRPGAAEKLATTVSQITRAVAGTPLDALHVVAPAWATACAAVWPDVSTCLPPEPVSRAIGDDDPAAMQGLWPLLALDPLLELRLAGLATGTQLPMVPGRRGSDAELTQLLLEAQPDPMALQRVEAPAASVDRALRTIAESSELAAAARSASSATDPELLDMAARAVVGQLLFDRRHPHATGAGWDLALYAISADADDLLFTIVRASLTGDSYRALTLTPVRSALLHLAARVATGWAVTNRARLMDPVTGFAADIAFYLAHGAQVRTFLAESILAAEPPILVLAHSLGGIAMVDLLSATQHPPVDLLVTAGSQAPYLYLCDALAHLRDTTRMAPDGATQSARPMPFTPWLNVYNKRDLLSFCAERVFPSATGVKDFPVDPGTPFPESHSAYWASPEMWEAVTQSWTGVAGARNL